MKRQRKLTGSQGQPQAWIALHKNRQKAYSHGEYDTIYLKDKQEFQIELYNPTSLSVLVKIKINGTYISDRGLILDPGQRWFLDRYIDSNRKFSFGTYNVEKTETNKEAISNNGLVNVEFYNEVLKNQYVDLTPYWENDWSKPYICYSGNTTDLPNTINCNYTGGNTNTTNTSSFTTFNTSQMINSNLSYDISNDITNEVTLDSLETGRIKEGNESSQTFEDGYGNFSLYQTKQTVFKLMPLSTKPIKKSEVRNYCVNCSARIRKTSWKFCPSCGEDLQC